MIIDVKQSTSQGLQKQNEEFNSSEVKSLATPERFQDIFKSLGKNNFPPYNPLSLCIEDIRKKIFAQILRINWIILIYFSLLDLEWS